ncbi:MAG: hypothetical protein WCI02_04830 [Planctomycetota bacterium]
MAFLSSVPVWEINRIGYSAGGMDFGSTALVEKPSEPIRMVTATGHNRNIAW